MSYPGLGPANSSPPEQGLGTMIKMILMTTSLTLQPVQFTNDFQQRQLQQQQLRLQQQQVEEMRELREQQQQQFLQQQSIEQQRRFNEMMQQTGRSLGR
jgi:uncharacterized protein HemX